jgi:hypothetical protein
VVAQRMGRRWVGVERSAEVVDLFALPRLRAALDGRGFTVVDVAPDVPQGLATSSTSAS